MRACKSCGTQKPLADFYRTANGGFMGRCKECAKERARQYRRDNIDSVREYDRYRSGLPHRVAMRKQVAQHRKVDPELRAVDHSRSHDWMTKNRLKRQAHIAVGNAIRNGSLVPQPCERCGYAVGVHAHHEDYEKPLEVTWLCAPCHGERHSEINEERRRTG